MNHQRSALIFFMDGVGLGGSDPAANPFVTARMPHLAALLGTPDWYLSRQPITAGRASFVPTGATMGVAGRPQSATGQATILTGRNVPQQVGEHYGPKPNAAVAAQIHQGTLFHEVIAAGGSAALLTPYPPDYFAAIASGRRLLSAVPLAASSASVELLTVEALRAGRAVSPGFTNEGWRDHLGYADLPLLSLRQAGCRIARLARDYQFSFFEHWPSDRSGHRGTLAQAVAHLEMLDEAIGGLLAGWDDERGLLILTSDHGNIEEKNHRQHSRNPVPTILVGRHHSAYAGRIESLMDIAPAVRQFLEIQKPGFSEKPGF